MLVYHVTQDIFSNVLNPLKSSTSPNPLWRLHMSTEVWWCRRGAAGNPRLRRDSEATCCNLSSRGRWHTSAKTKAHAGMREPGQQDAKGGLQVRAAGIFYAGKLWGHLIQAQCYRAQVVGSQWTVLSHSQTYEVS